MTDQDEETKEHPIYPEPANPTTPPTGMPGEVQPPGPFPGGPLQPPTTVNRVPPTPPSMAPINPGGPSFPQPSGPGWQGQNQWQQPAYGAPAYGQPGNAEAPGWAPTQPQGAPFYRTSVMVALAALLLIIFGLALAAFGGWTLTLGPDFTRFIRDNDIAIFGRQIDRDTLRTVMQPMPGILMVVGVLELLVGAVILAHRSWARWLGVLLALLGLVVSVVVLGAVLALVPGTSVQLVVAVALLIGYGFILLALIAGGGHFRKRYPGN
ncbi:MAG: hypothetical protein ABI744_04790 [Chloroflexota bacterium]